MKFYFTAAFIAFVFSSSILAQEIAVPKGIHQEESEAFKHAGYSAEYYEQNNNPATVAGQEKNNCQLEKYVFGWHPYWSNGLQVNYNWDLLSDMSYFSYEVNPNTGNAYTTHGFATAQAVTDALSNGVRVNLCVTLFSDHATFLSNATSRQTLISNLITLVQNRNAHGVNIDFESMPSSVSADYTSFMIDLCNQMHAAIPGSQVSIAMHAVDWSGFYDIPALVPYVDLFCIMGYDYYWTGSSTAGPNDPLFHFQSTYNYTLSKSTTYYLNEGVPENKLILGLPYYGREWHVSSHTLPATTLANGSSVTYRVVKNNASGDYALANRNFEPESRSVYYNFYDAGNPYQCFISEEQELGERMDFINKRGLAGMGIWALGYDDGYVQLWNEIQNHFTDCRIESCTGEIYDIGGGPFKNYYNNEDYVFTLAPENAVAIDVNFTEFDVEANYDYLYIYDGADQTAPQIPGSPFSGTSLPPSFTSSTGELTFRFVSDGLTVGSGFRANYTCITDLIPPTTVVNPALGWQTDDFQVSFNDLDDVNGSGLSKAYYHAGHFDGNEWRANAQRGFFNDDFEATTIHSDWTVVNGNWNENGFLQQSDEASGNTNIYAALNQSLSNQHVYHWKGRLSGAGTNRRAGLHIFCDDPSLTNRGNSYFVWFRLDDNLIQFYKVQNDNFGSPVINEMFNFSPNTWYDFKLIYDRISGEVWVYIDDVLAATWQDSAPYPTGDFISFRSGNATYDVDSFAVYRSRYPSVTVQVGPNPTDDIQYQNPDPSTSSGKVRSLVRDNANNLSTIDEQLIDIDWTVPNINYLNDGSASDQDTVYVTNVLQAPANWDGNDDHSGISEYLYAVGTTPFGTDIANWTSVGILTDVMVTSQDFIINEWYYFSLMAVNGALLSDSVSSDGFRLLSTAGLKENQLYVPVVYPNPASGFINISSHFPIRELIVFDQQGREIQRIKGNDQDFQSIDVTDFSAGNYTVQVRNDQGVFELKWLKR